MHDETWLRQALRSLNEARDHRQRGMRVEWHRDMRNAARCRRLAALNEPRPLCSEDGDATGGGPYTPGSAIESGWDED